MGCAQLSYRRQRILKALINEYIQSAKPVGSKTLCRSYGLRISPATVRHEMATLEDMGYLVQPHTSAGRMPTDMGLRFYVNHLLSEGHLAAKEKQKVRSFYRTGNMNWDDIFRETSRALSQMSRHVGLILSPRFEKTALQSISLRSLTHNRILVIFEFTSGIVERRVIENELNLRAGEFARMSNYLTEIGAGKNLMELRAELSRQSQAAEKLCDYLVRKALSLSEQIMDEAPELYLYIEGQANLLDQPEFSDMEKIKRFFQILEEKRIMIKLLDQALASKGVKVIIGRENPLESMQDYSLIACAYGDKERVCGALGVIGPVRLDYGKIISLVKFTSGLISDIMC
jgi:heat-inducible transcriptional repressor